MRQKNKKNIIIAADIFPPDIGGPATYAFAMAREFKNNGHNVKVVYYGQKNKKLPFRAYAIPKRLPVWIRYFCYFLRLMLIVKKNTIIYAQGVAASGMPACWVAKLTRVKLVVKIVGDYPWEQARVSGLTKLSIDDWQEHKVYIKKSFFDKISILVRTQKRVIKVADKIIAPSMYLKKVIIGWGADEEKIQVVYNAFAPSNVPRLTKEQAKKELNIRGDLLLSVNRFVPWKNLDFLIDIFSNLLIFNPDFKLILAGDGPEYQSLKQRVEEERLLDKIIFTGRLAKEKLALYYQASDIFLLPTGYEGFSHVLLEALDFGLPVIASEVGGNTELIDHEINGLLVPVQKKYAWVSAVKRLWLDPKLRKNLVKNNGIVKLGSFDFEQMYKNTEKIIFE